MWIADFLLLDFGVQREIELRNNPADSGYSHWEMGIGTDAESAMDDLLESLAYWNCYTEGLSARIRKAWNPTDLEGVGPDTAYQICLLYNLAEDTA